MTIALYPGWVWLVAYVLLMVAAVVFCAGLDPEEVELDAPWEDVELGMTNPRMEEDRT